MSLSSSIILDTQANDGAHVLECICMCVCVKTANSNTVMHTLLR